MLISHVLTQILETALALDILRLENNFDSGDLQSNLTPVFWAPFLVSETVTVACVINKAWKSHKLLGLNRNNGSTLLDTLIRHSLLYYFSYACFS